MIYERAISKILLTILTIPNSIRPCQARNETRDDSKQSARALCYGTFSNLQRFHGVRGLLFARIVGRVGKGLVVFKVCKVFEVFGVALVEHEHTR